jgi:hypothetical protein
LPPKICLRLFATHTRLFNNCLPVLESASDIASGQLIGPKLLFKDSLTSEMST